MNDKDALTPSRGRPVSPTTRRFGAQLRAFRETYWERTAAQDPRGAPAPRMRLSALSLIDCLSKAGYKITSGAYSEIESGNSVPRETKGFLDAVSGCLKLSDDEKQTLIATLGYELVAPRLGPQADVILRRTASTARALRHWRTKKGFSYLELATRLIENGLALEGYSDPSRLAFFLELLEFGRPCELGDPARVLFLDKMETCLGEEARRELALGFADDLLRMLLPNVKPGFDDTMPGK